MIQVVFYCLLPDKIDIPDSTDEYLLYRHHR